MLVTPIPAHHMARTKQIITAAPGTTCSTLCHSRVASLQRCLTLLGDNLEPANIRAQRATLAALIGMSAEDLTQPLQECLNSALSIMLDTCPTKQSGTQLNPDTYMPTTAQRKVSKQLATRKLNMLAKKHAADLLQSHGPSKQTHGLVMKQIKQTISTSPFFARFRRTFPHITPSNLVPAFPAATLGPSEEENWNKWVTSCHAAARDSKVVIRSTINEVAKTRSAKDRARLRRLNPRLPTATSSPATCMAA
jgi:hypothetical protein